MIFKVEVGIDIDEKRKIWLEASATADPKDATAQAVVKALTENVVEQALVLQERATAQGVISGALAGGDGRAPSERPKRPDDPETMRTMQED